jgi:hypothetical protein
MRKSDIDNIIKTQLIIGRMGEKELMNWWNIDIAYEMGGADFLKRLLGDTLALLAAGEGILKAAHLKESQLINEMPENQSVFSLFRPESQVAVAIEDRLRHFKRYPEDLPEEIKHILDPEKDWASNDLADLISTDTSVPFTGSSFGKEIKKTIGLGIADLMTQLASIIKTNEKSRYVLCYYRETEDASA